MTDKIPVVFDKVMWKTANRLYVVIQSVMVGVVVYLATYTFWLQENVTHYDYLISTIAMVTMVLGFLYLSWIRRQVRDGRIILN